MKDDRREQRIVAVPKIAEEKRREKDCHGPERRMGKEMSDGEDQAGDHVRNGHATPAPAPPGDGGQGRLQSAAKDYFLQHRPKHDQTDETAGLRQRPSRRRQDSPRQTE